MFGTFQEMSISVQQTTPMLLYIKRLTAPDYCHKLEMGHLNLISFYNYKINKSWRIQRDTERINIYLSPITHQPKSNHSSQVVFFLPSLSFCLSYVCVAVCEGAYLDFYNECNLIIFQKIIGYKNSILQIHQHSLNVPMLLDM